MSATVEHAKQTKVSPKKKRRYLFDYTPLNEAVRKAGVDRATAIIAVYLNGDDAHLLILEHPALAHAPKNRRKSIEAGEKGCDRWFVQALINSLVVWCNNTRIRMVVHRTTDDALRVVFSKLSTEINLGKLA